MYDYENEHEYAVDAAGTKYILGTAGSFILVCPTCGDERFRGELDPRETCWNGHGKMQPLTYDNIEAICQIWKAAGDTISTVEDRRRDRIAREMKCDASDS